MYAQNRSPPTIHCEFPGRTCNNCQKDLSSKVRTNVVSEPGDDETGNTDNYGEVMSAEAT